MASGNNSVWNSIYVVLAFLFSFNIANATSTFSYHGRVFDAANENPITESANFNLKIQTANNCILFDETQKNVILSDFGVFSLEVGKSQKMSSMNIYRDTQDPGLGMAKVFSFVQASELKAPCASDITPMDTNSSISDRT